MHDSDSNQFVSIDYMELDRIIDDEFNNDKENLVMILQAIQNRYGYLPEPCLTYLSEKIGVRLSDIYSVGTFYSTFSLEPRGRNIISVCLGTACYVRGGARLWEGIQQMLEVGPSQTTQDKRFTIEPVRCIGCCSLGPVLKVNEDIHSRMSRDEITGVLQKYQ